MHATLKDQAYAYIRDKLLTGAIAQGDRVSDANISRKLGISRTPVREALVHLEAQGLIEQQPGTGPRVKVMDRHELEESFEVREILESSAVCIAAQRITDQELTQVEELCIKYASAVDRLRDASTSIVASLTEQFNILDMAFHLKIIAAAKNRQLLRVVTDLQLLTRITVRRVELERRNSTRVPVPRGGIELPIVLDLQQRVQRVLVDHRAISDALRQHDPEEASATMSRHLQWSRDYHFQAFDWAQRQRVSDASSLGEELSFPLHLVQRLQQLEHGEMPGKDDDR